MLKFKKIKKIPTAKNKMKNATVAIQQFHCEINH